MADADPVAAARVIYEQMQADLLAASPLGDMARWVASGAPPPAQALRGAGFACEAAPGELWLARKAFIRRWGFAIPCAEAVAALKTLSPLLEIGAGSGAWAAMLRAAGLDVVATDAVAEGSPGYGLVAGEHFPVEPLDAVSAVRRYPERNLFCSWPTEADDWCAEAARALAPGRALALIGKGRGGTTGSAALFDVLDAHFGLESTVAIPQFPGVDDAMTVHRKRQAGARRLSSGQRRQDQRHHGHVDEAEDGLQHGPGP